jgi:C1A family cysteine protease
MKRVSWTKISITLLASMFVLAILASGSVGEQSEDEKIAELNKRIQERGHHWIAGRTSVSDLSPEEKQKLLGLKPVPEGFHEQMTVYSGQTTAQLDDVFDWRALNGTTPAKNQGGCGSCWAFAAVGQLEAHMRIYDERLEDLSEQQSIECNTYGADCDGGWAHAAYEVFLNPGAVHETCMPYEARDDLPCIQDQCEVQGRISDFTYIPGNINNLKNAILDGPVFTTMTVVDDFYNYTSGCYELVTSDVQNHAVLLVGWDDYACAGEGAWIVKNSWGEGWGIDGYCYMKYGAARIGEYGYQIDYIPSIVFVRVDAPNGGEIIDVGDDYLIEWVTARETPDSINVLLSIDGGANYDYTIVRGLAGSSTSYMWTADDLPVKTARVKVEAWFGGEVGGYDTSDNDFTIKGKPYKYVSPTGGNQYPYSLPAWAAHHIQDAIDASDPGDSVMVTAATYSYTVMVDSPVYLMGGWNSDFTVRDPQTYVTTIQFAGSVVSFMNNDPDFCGIEGFTLTGGTGTALSLPVTGIYGGGIFSYNSSPTIKDNIITSCGYTSVTQYSAGGGISCYGGSATIESNTFSACEAQSGGGIYLYQTSAVIRGNNITGSFPNGEYGGAKKGGGVYSLYSTATFENNLIEDNDGYVSGGGVSLKFGTASFNGDTIAMNDCSGSGGGIYSERTALTLAHTVIRENASSSSGGGLYHAYAEITLENSIIAENSAGIIAGGVYADSCWGVIDNNTVDRNFGAFGGGNIFIPTAEGLTVRNNLITYAQTNGFQANSLTNLTFQYNNCYGNTPADVATITPDSTNTSRNPHYSDTTAYDYHLLVNSGGIDTGDPSGPSDPDGSRADQGAFGGSGAIMAAPEYVKSLSAAADGDTIDLQWDHLPPGNLDYYAIYGDTVPDFLPDAANQIGIAPYGYNTFSHYPLAECWYYRVSGVNTSGYGGGYATEASACASGGDVTPPEVTVVYPNGGESFGQGDTIEVQWIATDDTGVDSVSILYCTDGGTQYTLIASGEPNDSTYDWIIPQVASDSCLVKVIAYDPGMLTGEGTSDSLFSIEEVTGIGDIDDPGETTPRYVTALEQNYPNPFNGTTTIAYTLAEPSHVDIRIYDPAGRLVRIVESGAREQGRHTAIWNGKDNAGHGVASGVYFCRLKAGKVMQTRKIIYLR